MLVQRVVSAAQGQGSPHHTHTHTDASEDGFLHLTSEASEAVVGVGVGGHFCVFGSFGFRKTEFLTAFLEFFWILTRIGSTQTSPWWFIGVPGTGSRRRETVTLTTEEPPTICNGPV